ncbi:unnamed protein product [Rotaria magnacalcarata]|uniref:Uncharacterized protein n=3 Tax=Rotaria magnacalcarata TaxID=392030 RepID=A0A816NCD7_9BILA|nr:unnamed protein product [Rotaria magnacalcarata]CAF2151981.1 unnamed protein product [Rotaria magnacalcarata]
MVNTIKHPFTFQMPAKRRLNKTTTNSSTKKKTMKQVEHIDQEGSQHPSNVTGYATNEHPENPILAGHQEDDNSDDSMLANPPALLHLTR